MKIEPKQDGASFDVVVVLDPLSQGTDGFVTLFLKIIVTVPTPLSYKAHLHKILFQNLHLKRSKKSCRNYFSGRSNYH